MFELLKQVRIKVNEGLYLKDPESTELGKLVIKNAIDLIHDIGFEQFTFKKLAESLQSTESTIYRYFENKHKLLLYLMNWYWGWLEYKFFFSTANIDTPENKLHAALIAVLETGEQPDSHENFDIHLLNQIVISELPKTYLTKDVDSKNKEGFFAVYKRLCRRISSIILEINPDYNFPDSLASTVIEGAHLQYYFREHLPSLTSFSQSDTEITQFYKDLILTTIKK